MKKITAIALAIAMALSCFMMQALAATPSKSTGNMTTAKADGFELIIEEIDEKVHEKWLSEQAEALQEHVKAGTPVAEFFGGKADDVTAMFPEGSELIAAEVARVKASGYKDTMGAQSAIASFPEEFADDQNVAVLLGFNRGEAGMEWMIQEATPVNGKLRITFTVGQLVRLCNEDGMLAVITD